MGSKILDHLESTHLGLIALLGKTDFERRLLRRVTSREFRMCMSEGKQGIDRCKQWHNNFLSWLELGKPAVTDDYRRDRYCHSTKYSLNTAKRYILRLDEKNADRFSDAFVCALRTYQVFGPTEKEMKKEWLETIRSRIVDPMDKVDNISLLVGLMGLPYRSTLNPTIYSCARSVRHFFDYIEKNPDESQMTKAYYNRLKLSDKANILYKKSPVVVSGFGANGSKDKSLVSILAAPLDAIALQHTPVDVQNVIKLDSISDIYPIDSFPKKMSEMLNLWKRPDAPNMYELVRNLGDRVAGAVPGWKNDVIQPAAEDTHIPDNIRLDVGRTVLLQDKAGKTRAVSCAGYVTNNVLKPIHDYVMGIVRNLPHDATDQPLAIPVITEWTRDEKAYLCSADLTAATDRLPIDLQVYILYRCLSLTLDRDQASAIANAWYQLICSLPFRSPYGDEYIRYGVGQPMGLYSSWPLLALSNHTLSNAARFKYDFECNNFDRLKRFPKSCVCGDDIVFNIRKAAERYIAWMNALGVKVNQAKSHVTYREDSQKVAEFTKKIWVNGKIISSTSPKLLIHATQDISLLHEALIELRRTNPTVKARDFSSLDIAPIRNKSRISFIPEQYGGFGFRNDKSYSDILYKSAFIDMYIYKRLMNGLRTANHTYVDLTNVQVAADKSLIDQAFIDRLCLCNGDVYTPWRDSLREHGSKVAYVYPKIYDIIDFFGNEEYDTDQFSAFINAVIESFTELHDVETHIVYEPQNDADKLSRRKHSAAQWALHRTVKKSQSYNVEDVSTTLRRLTSQRVKPETFCLTPLCNKRVDHDTIMATIGTDDYDQFIIDRYQAVESAIMELSR